MKVHSLLKTLLYFSISVCFCISCTTETPSAEKIPVTQLSNFETLISVEDEILATPVILKHEKELGFFIYDEALGKVLWLNEEGKKVQVLNP